MRVDGNGRYQLHTFHNQQTFDFDSLRGRFLSSSYAPLPDDPQYQVMIDQLRELFDQYQENGQIIFHYNTRLYYDAL